MISNAPLMCVYEDQEAETNAYFSKSKTIASSSNSAAITVRRHSTSHGTSLNWLT